MALCYLQGVQNGEYPRKHSCVFIDSQQAKHPSDPQYWQKNHSSNQQFSADVCNSTIIVISTVFGCKEHT